MSLAGNTYWNTARKNSSTQETWLIQLFYDDEAASKFIGLAAQTLNIDDVIYHGIVEDFGSINDSIDLSRSSASTDNVGVICANHFKNKAFAEELFGGSRKYINRKVNIYSRIGDTTNLNECQLLDTFRLYNIQQLSGGKLKLDLEKKTPTDHISIPQTKYKDVYFPITYGDFIAKGGDTITGTNLFEGNDSDMSDSSAHQYEADPSDPPTFWDLNTTVSGKMYIALTSSDLMGIRHTATTLFEAGVVYDISFKARTASGSGAKLYLGGHPSDGSGNPMIQATTGTEATYTGTFEVGGSDTRFYIFAVADIGTASQAFEIDDIEITVSATDTVTDAKKLFPANYLGDSGNTNYRFGVDASAGSGAEPYMYDSAHDVFHKMTDGSTATTTFGLGQIISFNSLDRELIVRPQSTSSVDVAVQDVDNMHDGDITTRGYIPISFSQASSTPLTKSLTFNFPDVPEDDVSNGNFYIKAGIELISYTESSANFSNFDMGMGSLTVDINVSGEDDGTLPDYEGVIIKTSSAGDTYEHETHVTTYASSKTITATIDFSHLSGTYSGQVNFYIYDVYMTVDVEPDYTTEPNAQATEIRRITDYSTGRTIGFKKVAKRSTVLQSDDQFEEARTSSICAAIDGKTQSYTGGSGLAENVHEVFRDLLARYAGFDTSDANLTGWSDIDTARNDWAVRWWLNEPRSLKSILNQLQYEGGFIFKFYQAGGKFIFVKDNPAGDSVHTIGRSDIDRGNIKTKLSEFADLITHTEYNYERHPAKGGYVSQSTYTNSTARTNWWPSIASEENKEAVNLDFLVKNPYTATDTNPNDCIALYYNNILADPKIIAECTIINKDMFDLETGDIVQFESETVASNDGRSVKAYGKDFADLYFMITKTRRTINSLKIEAREVYSI